MVPPMEQAAAAAFVNNVMGKLFQALGLVETYKMLRDLKPESESLLQELRMLAAAVDDELTASEGTRRTAVARAYSSEMRALTHDVEDCIERFVHRVAGGGLDGTSRLRRAVHTVSTLCTCYRFAAEIMRLKKRVQEARARVLKPPEGGSRGGQPTGSRPAAGRRAADHAARHPVVIERPMEELLAQLNLDQLEGRPRSRRRRSRGSSPSSDLAAWGKLPSREQCTRPPLSPTRSLVALGSPCARVRTAMPRGFWRTYTSSFFWSSNIQKLRSPSTSRIRGTVP
ncbi:unnamed protein product [Urochloa humidicola]